jgi:hypothetical protein
MARRKFVAASAALGAAFLLPLPLQAADIREMTGNVRVNGKRATRTTRIKAGDTVETGPGGTVWFVIGKDAFLLRERSRVSFDKAGTKSTVIGALRVVNGGLLAAFGEGARRLRTPTATAGIRGTAIYVEASAPRTYFCTCYGTVDLSDKTGKERKLVISGYHTGHMVYAKPIAGSKMSAAEFKHHTDAELVKLEKLVGRTSPILQRNQRLKESEQPEDGQPMQQAPSTEQQPPATQQQAPSTEPQAPSTEQRAPRAEPEQAAPAEQAPAAPEPTPDASAAPAQSAAKPADKPTPSAEPRPPKKSKPSKRKPARKPQTPEKPKPSTPAQPEPSTAPATEAPAGESTELPDLPSDADPIPAPAPPPPGPRLPPARLDE